MNIGNPNETFGLDVSHVRYLHKLLAKLGVRGADAQDIAQTVLLSAHRASGSFRGAASTHTWLYRICIRAVGLHRRRIRARSLLLIPAVDMDANTETPLEELLSKERSAALQEYLHTLSHEQREVWLLHDLHGLPMREVAARIGCPLQTAYSRLHAARHALALKALEVAWIA